MVGLISKFMMPRMLCYITVFLSLTHSRVHTKSGSGRPRRKLIATPKRDDQPQFHGRECTKFAPVRTPHGFASSDSIIRPLCSAIWARVNPAMASEIRSLNGKKLKLYRFVKLDPKLYCTVNPKRQADLTIRTIQVRS